MYGKYGFNISQYIQSVRDAADKVNAEEPGSITQAEVDAVVASISGGATDEANILDNDILRSHFNDHLSVQGLSADQLEKLMQIYVQFQNERQAKFADAESWSPQPPDFQVRYGLSMKPVLIDCLGQMKNVLGESTYSAIFAALPEQAAGFLLQG
jgi:hypothetical protein